MDSQTPAEPRQFAPAIFPSLFAMEESILKFWQDNQTFQASLDKNKDGEVYSFYDGPPFITGTPHYATLLPSIAKDVVPRYQTMLGKYVRRKWGWDVHGLPAETQVEKRLGLKTKRDIEELGVDKFIAECRKYVAEVSDTWGWYIDHIGRWADMDNAYRTDQLDFMESVIWAFKSLYDQGLIYKGSRTSLYCTRCATPLSKFEVTMDDDSYREVTDQALTVAFKDTERDLYYLAWTTTPWTLPANAAIGVNPDIEYVTIEEGSRKYVLAHQALERYPHLDRIIIDRYPGSQLVGRSYQPLYSFLPTNPAKDFKLYAAEFVDAKEGTGLVHIAPAFGEADAELGKQAGLTVLSTLDDDGHFVDGMGEWGGKFYAQTNQLILEELSGRGLVLESKSITHSFPHCYRCGTPLIYRAQPAWYLKISELKERLIKKNQDINWIPNHFGSGRFNHNLENAPDWCLSRTRYWGTPIPVWQTEDGELLVPGSLAEIEQMSGTKITDLHRPAIDQVVLTTAEGKKAHRVPEVLDCWFESGSMPFGQDHYPFEAEADFKRHAPADFIVEYTGQLRGWFYYLHVLANALQGQNAFKNVLVTGVLMGTDGRKMSKSYGNYPDPRGVLEKYGAEALRLYFMSSKIMMGEDTDINELEIRESSRLINVLHNTLRYFITYANLHNFAPNADEATSNDVMDHWISSRLSQFVAQQYQPAMDRLDLPAAHQAIRPFIEDLSTWYIRRSRDRFVSGDRSALATLHQVLITFARAIAPSLPFSAELMFRNLTRSTGSESVHLEDYPNASELASVDEKLLEEMSLVRRLASLGLNLRSGASVNIRQPLSKLQVTGVKSLADWQQELLKDELNVLSVNVAESLTFESLASENELSVALDFNLTDELVEAGQLRELARLIQAARKESGLQVGQLAQLNYQAEAKWRKILTNHAEEIKRICALSEIAEQKESQKIVIDAELSLDFS